MKNKKNQLEKEIMEQFDTEFSCSELWDLDNYPKTYNAVKKFIREILKKTEIETEIRCEKEYRVFIKEMRKEYDET